ncbi:MAG TPA: hypothetical protein VLA95_02710 [Gemmatimonadales bacterium]|nr:hypothetical protein [Gemmatimonadales bacterium]
MTRKLLLPAVLLLAGACAKGERTEGAMLDSAAAMAPAGASADAGVERAVAVYRGIEANPAAAESVLTAHGLTAATLDSLIYEIAADSARAAAYTDAIR